MKRVLMLLLMVSFAEAKPEYFNVLSAQFPSGTLVHKCNTCHNNGPALNLFGKDYAAVFITANPLKIPGVNIMNLNQKMDYLLNKMDSNGNGVSNYNDIKAGVNPGKK